MLQFIQCQTVFPTVGNWKNASGATTRRSHCIASLQACSDRGSVDSRRSPESAPRPMPCCQFNQPVGISRRRTSVAAQVRTRRRNTGATAPVSPTARTFSPAAFLHRLAQLLDELRVERIASFPDAVNSMVKTSFDAGDTDHAAKPS